MSGTKTSMITLFTLWNWMVRWIAVVFSTLLCTDDKTYVWAQWGAKELPHECNFTSAK